jgi:hypothetical protein
MAAAVGGFDLVLRKSDMLAEKRIDRRAGARAGQPREMGAPGIGDLERAVAAAHGKIGADENFVVAGLGDRRWRRHLPVSPGGVAQSKSGQQALGRLADARYRRRPRGRTCGVAPRWAARRLVGCTVMYSPRMLG